MTIRAAWTYRDPKPGYEDLRDRIVFYAGRVDAAWVDDERVSPQPGRFYGGWVTANIVGPFKGEPGHRGLVTQAAAPTSSKRSALPLAGVR